MNFLRVTVHHYWNHKEIKNVVIPVIPATIFLFPNHLIKEAPQFSWGKHLIYSSGLSKQDIKWNNYFCLSIESDIVIKFGRRTWPCSRSFQYFCKTENQTKNRTKYQAKKPGFCAALNPFLGNGSHLLTLKTPENLCSSGFF